MNSHMNKLKVKDAPFLYRDVESNGIINTDNGAYNEHIKKKRAAQAAQLEREQTNQKLQQLEQDVSDLRDGIAQILDILKSSKS